MALPLGDQRGSGTMTALPAASRAVSVVCGALFALGWWLVIDGYAYGQSHCAVGDRVSAALVLLPLMGTAALVLLSTVSSSVIAGSPNKMFESSGTGLQRVLLFLYLAMSFCALAVSVFVYFVYHAPDGSIGNQLPHAVQPIGVGCITLR